MYNTHLSDQQVAAIDEQVAKVLRGLGDPEPPLRLEDVRELLDLDRKFYSSEDNGYLRETISRLIVGGKQVLKRPTLAWEAVKKRNLKALWVPDRKRILIDRTTPELKWRWSEGHEIGHSIIPWHEYMLHGDDRHSLAPSAEQELEAEANYAAGRLLFLRGEFDDRLQSNDIDFAAIHKLAKEFDNTKTTTLWRAVEAIEEPAFGMVTQHPAQQADPEKDLFRYFVRSRVFANQFPDVTQTFLFAQLQTVCRPGGGPIGRTDVVLMDANGDRHIFHMEAFYNGHESLTLGIHQGAARLSVAV